MKFAERSWSTARSTSTRRIQRLARLIVRSEKEEAAAQFADTLAGGVRGGDQARPQRRAAPRLRLLGPAECPVFRLNNFYRFHFQVQSDEQRGAARGACATCWRSPSRPSNVEFQVDMDPFNMLCNAHVRRSVG